MNQIYKAENYQITFFVPEHKALILQRFIQVCDSQGYQFGLTPYGLTSVKCKKSQKDELYKIFRRYFEKEKVQETIEILAKTRYPQFLPYGPTFEVDMRPYLLSDKKIDLTTVKPIEIYHRLYLDPEMTWGFMSQVLSLPNAYGRQSFAEGQVISRFKIDTYFDHLEGITPHLGKNGYFQFIYEDAGDSLAVSKACYEEGEVVEVQPTRREHILRPSEYVVIKPLWYDYEYK